MVWRYLAAEIFIIPTGLAWLAGQAIRLVRRLRLCFNCFCLCGWGRQLVAQLCVSLTSVSGQHGRDRQTIYMASNCRSSIVAALISV
jgi:hypothetical protein